MGQMVMVGPEYETEYSTTRHADGLETSSLGLKFVVTSKHFLNGNMKLKCTATISRIYTMSNEEMVFGGRQQTSGLHISENMSRMRDSATQNPAVRWTVALLASCCVFDITTGRHVADLVCPEVTNDDLQQNQCSRSFSFSVIYHKTGGKNLPEPTEFHSVPMSDLPDDIWS
ncbi:uncharacterized protein TNCV_3993821 [Trichonephila clavipes]|uniref:Uncharacterized protein n=1 Tax=Trichonephila clavipes TaxID=2585209 RepID=A0A8X6VSL1_TRICX|nr:uncharacterized protein TNCV_3993821 [Trichonephila clavipes]